MGKSRRIYTLKETLDGFLSKNKALLYKIKSQEALSSWSRVVDQYVEAHTTASLVKDGVLFVNTDSTVLANELSLREETLRADLNGVLGSAVVKKIVFKSGQIIKKEKIKSLKKVNNKKITLKTLNVIDETVRQIEEDGLRFVLRKFLISAAMRNKDSMG